MKRLELTPELISLIHDRVGPDVDTDGIAVFESISLNNLPLPGKKGTIWEGAIATPLTLRQIADHINNGGHIPLVMNHDMSGVPKGRVFQAGIDYSSSGDFELRTLFYLDKTEAEMAAKIDAGSMDEVSISFLPTSYQCSECDFDYLGEGANWENFYTRTCSNDHEVGKDGVHVRMVGLASLIELSLVARGAADKPKIVGRSTSKLAPASAQRLAAAGFEIDGLVCQASRGESTPMDTNKLTADLIDAKTQVGVLTAAATAHEAQLTAAHTARDEALGQVATLTAERDELQTKLTAAEGESRTADAEAAVTWLTASLTKLLTAAGKTAENLPTDVAALTAAIDAETQGLTALIPAGGASQQAGGDDTAPKADLSAFKTRK
ncbi:hypothetical protein [Sphingomonas jaspsi]|uniref:hypothetical protein n=1 Tax=Sphingomonas jaspsi TaxID=392409 RepID=UPI0004B61189|nr:hypothetical protein [Sphingomonas jaspsi]